MSVNAKMGGVDGSHAEVVSSDCSPKLEASTSKAASYDAAAELAASAARDGLNCACNGSGRGYHCVEVAAHGDQTDAAVGAQWHGAGTWAVGVHASGGALAPGPILLRSLIRSWCRAAATVSGGTAVSKLRS